MKRYGGAIKFVKERQVTLKGVNNILAEKADNRIVGPGGLWFHF